MILDRHISIFSIMVEVFLDVHYSYCCHHLHHNMQFKHKKNTKVAQMYWKVAKTYTEYEFREIMNSLSPMHPDIAAYLYEVGFDRWAKAYFLRQRKKLSNVCKSLQTWRCILLHLNERRFLVVANMMVWSTLQSIYVHVKNFNYHIFSVYMSSSLPDI